MNRMERMTGILLLIQERGSEGPYRAAELADHFEVSRRTILRDMDGLCQIGVPVVSRDGPGGGFFLPKDYSLTPLPLTVNESILMVFALSALDRLGDAPFAAARETLRAKLRSLVSARHAEDVGRTLGALSFDVPERATRAPFLDLLIESAETSAWLRVTYRSASRLSTQHLLPLHLSTSGGFWYCRAYSFEHGEERTYRVDRVIAAERADPPEPVRPKANVDYTHESHPQICIRLTAEGVERVEQERHLGAAITREMEGGGVLRLRCPPSELRWYAEYVASLGRHAEAISPPELRDRVRGLGLDIAGRHREKESESP